MGRRAEIDYVHRRADLPRGRRDTAWPKFSGSVEFIDNLCQEFVGGNDRVVIGIYHGLLVLMIDFFNVVGVNIRQSVLYRSQ